MVIKRFGRFVAAAGAVGLLATTGMQTARGQTGLIPSVADNTPPAGWKIRPAGHEIPEARAEISPAEHRVRDDADPQHDGNQIAGVHGMSKIGRRRGP